MLEILLTNHNEYSVWIPGGGLLHSEEQIFMPYGLTSQLAGLIQYGVTMHVVERPRQPLPPSRS